MESGQFFGSKKLQKYPCKNCGQPIKPGQYFAWNRTGGTFRAGWHWDCSRADERPPEDKIYRRNPPSAASATPGAVKLPTCRKCGKEFQSEQEEVHHFCTAPASKEQIQEAARELQEEEAVNDNPGEDSDGEIEVTGDSNDGMAALARSLAPYLRIKGGARITPAMEQAFKDALAKAAHDLEAKFTHRIEIVTTNGAVKVLSGLQHKQLPQVIQALKTIRQGRRRNVLLWGSPGAGKTEMAMQVATAFGLPFYGFSLNPQTSDTRLIGFKDVNGIFHSAAFAEAFEKGGVVLIDEVFNASGNLLTSFNSALSNGFLSVGDRQVQRHPDFILICSDNTNGRGASRNHSERRTADGATIERLTYIEVEYDDAMERAIAVGIKEDCDGWLNWVRGVRKYAAQHYPALIVSPRASYEGLGLLADGFTAAQAADMALFKGFDKPSVANIIQNCGKPIA